MNIKTPSGPIRLIKKLIISIHNELTEKKKDKHEEKSGKRRRIYTVAIATDLESLSKEANTDISNCFSFFTRAHTEKQICVKQIR